ncbi:cation transporter [Lysinibacillus sphaericus]|uniref:Cation diffusion facilitator family transporter n=1 Tax=Lysinibacillus sphaericus TaxID=1421 RepID=A0A2S0JXB0_LYSSH|nr:cation diffusion facilitator family transporter [Lysinibacillus sphaericus]AVK95775.1 cation diffusion facilitator family transporter [Lysinibacillus sphaericus]MED4546099.1 cation diffusion facilitator family transporter [Lysinibacillus sphaericus]TKI16253.1 cation transporter [Lysinibacillus sphaericus]SUV18485.1 cation diffusion facilitator family transporter [Lysinibacillus sphaericus]GEC82972.1 cation diffusion facilitator transporter [Lysinibacillus sphaericus]
MTEILKLLKDGNKPSLMAAFVNTFLGIIKGIAFFFTGNVAMFAEMMHSLGDAANQFFVYIGSALSKKAPTKQFPGGFGRIVNLVCLFAVIIVAILSYETIKEGWHHFMHPSGESKGMFIALGVLFIGIVLEGTVLAKAAVEVLHEAGQEKAGLASIAKAFTYLKRAKPATKLVFMEDLVATGGNVLAFAAILIAHFTGWARIEGLVSIIIGCMMFYVVGKVFLDNARGVIGETDEEMLNHIAHLVMDNPNIKDIVRLEVMKEGEFLHVELVAEADPNLSLAYLDDVRDHLTEVLLSQKGVSKVAILFDEDDGRLNWQHVGERPTKEQ